MTAPDAAAAREVRAELLSPAELDAAIASTPLAYLPLGSLEFHGPHLPIGLDALNAYGVCLGAAGLGGGIVLPTIHQGTGGEHSDYPWTIMMHDDSDIRSVIIQTLVRLQTFGVRRAVLFTGHFAGEQQSMIDTIAEKWNADGHPLQVVATGVNRSPASSIAPDHAGVFETTLLNALHPELVHIDRLPSVTERPADDPDGNPMGPQRHDPANPLWGIFGPDPREFDPNASAPLLEALVTWLAALAASR
jgi:creatinine amidohydrolase